MLAGTGPNVVGCTWCWSAGLGILLHVRLRLCHPLDVAIACAVSRLVLMLSNDFCLLLEVFGLIAS